MKAWGEGLKGLYKAGGRVLRKAEQQQKKIEKTLKGRKQELAKSSQETGRRSGEERRKWKGLARSDSGEEDRAIGREGEREGSQQGGVRGGPGDALTYPGTD